MLYSAVYGYHAGSKIHRACFDGRNMTSANVMVQNGAAAGWAAWLNGVYAGDTRGDPSLAATSAELTFNSSVLRDADNALTIVMDYTGHDQPNVKPAGTQNPRGIPGTALFEGEFHLWRIQDNAVGEANIDPVRGPMKVGGLDGERLG